MGTLLRLAQVDVASQLQELSEEVAFKIVGLLRGLERLVNASDLE